MTRCVSVYERYVCQWKFWWKWQYKISFCFADARRRSVFRKSFFGLLRRRTVAGAAAVVCDVYLLAWAILIGALFPCVSTHQVNHCKQEALERSKVDIIYKSFTDRRKRFNDSQYCVHGSYLADDFPSHKLSFGRISLELQAETFTTFWLRKAFSVMKIQFRSWRAVH